MITCTSILARPEAGATPASEPAPFVGRSLAAYERSFALDLPALKHRDVLDVGAGPSSFTAEAVARRIDAVAVDPCYADPADNLRLRVEQGLAPARPRPFRPSGLAWPRRPAPEQRATAERFLQDYEAHYAHGRYVAGALPQLPFFDGTFDLVLCGHLLFSDPVQFDLEWHAAACRELVRVSADAVRIHPLCAPDGRTYPGLARLRRELRATGVASQVAEGGALLVLRRAVP